MKYLIVLVVLWSGSVVGQNREGVCFNQNKDWNQVKKDAKMKGMFIFLDCYASWCGPCKDMDKSVYVSDTVGRFINSRFISVKVQIDTLNGLGSDVNATFRNIVRQYGVDHYPTFLFFDPKGKLVHEAIGYRNIKDFLEVASNATLENRQYYTLLRRYNDGRRDYKDWPYLAKMAEDLGKIDLSRKIGEVFVSDYLLQLDKRELMKKERLRLLCGFTYGVTDKGFKFLLANKIAVDSVLGGMSAERKLVSVIEKGEIKPFLSNETGQADWETVESRLTDKYDSLGEFAYIEQRLSTAWDKKNWSDFRKFYILYFEDMPNLNIFNANNASWAIFQHCDDSSVLSEALDVMIRYRSSDINWTDTYANLLYKNGKVKDAILFEKQAVSLEEKSAYEMKRSPDIYYRETLIKMMNGKPTW